MFGTFTYIISCNYTTHQGRYYYPHSMDDCPKFDDIKYHNDTSKKLFLAINSGAIFNASIMYFRY